MMLLRLVTLSALLLASSVLVFADEESKPILMSTTGASTWSDLADLQKQADEGKRDAMAALGEMLLTGDQVTKDVAKGISYLEKASAAGHPNATFRLGKIYEDGELAARDPMKALDFYRKAALKGVSEAQYNLGAMYVSARGVRRDYKEGLAWLIVATKNGAAAEGEAQVRERLKSTNRPSVIAEGEARAIEIAKEIDAAKGAQRAALNAKAAP